MYTTVARQATRYLPHILRWGITFGSGIWLGVQHGGKIFPSSATEQPTQSYTLHEVNAAYLQAMLDLYHGQKIDDRK